MRRFSFQLELLQEIVAQAIAKNDPALGEQALDTLERESFLLQELFHSDPSMALSGKLFEIAEHLSESGLQLARYFRQVDEIDREERAWHLRYASLHIARTHQRNIMGPALLDWADCLRRMEQFEKADSLYNSVIEDFTTILGWGPTFNEDWIEAVKSLQTALHNSRKDYGDLSERVDLILRQSEQLKLARTAS